MLKLLLSLFLIPLLFTPAFGIESQTAATDQGTLNVKIATAPVDPKPGDDAKLQIDFINPTTDKIQEHIDYRVTVSKDGKDIVPRIPLTHTSSGSVPHFPVKFAEEGNYEVLIEVEGILFQPIPLETVSFNLPIGEASAQPPTPESNGGGCLIATAAFGSELSPQVQQLREIRDNVVMGTESGTGFMNSFNHFYYSFSPAIADYERENQIFKEAVKLTITPLISSLSILSYVEIESEQEMLGYGIGVILLNIGMYLGIPAFAILKLYQFSRK